MAPVVRLARTYAPSATPSQVTSSDCIFTSCSWPLITVVLSSAVAGGGAAEAYDTLVVVADSWVGFPWPSGAPAGANTRTNSPTVVPGAIPPSAPRSAITASPPSNVPLLLVSWYSTDDQPIWLFVVASVTLLPAPLPSSTLPLLDSRCV